MNNVLPMTKAPATPLDFALAYARLGWHVFPAFWVKEDGSCACDSPKCTGNTVGKHPIGWLAKRGQDDSTTDESKIRSWWDSAPQANVAVMLAPSGLVAIDIDPRNGGWDTIDDLETKHGAIQSDVLQLTGGGGEHRVFSLPSDQAASLPGKLGPGVDVKRNGYIIVEPSNHRSGNSYGWEASSNPLEGLIPSPVPDWLRGSFRTTANYVLPASPVQPLAEKDRVDLEAALHFISSDERDTWVQVGMALHSTSAGSEAFMLWDRWSQSSAKYDARDSTRVWLSFRNKGLSGVTKLTVFGLAMANGWPNENDRPLVEVDTTIKPAPVPTLTSKKSNLGKIPVPALQDVAEWMSGLYEKYHPDISVAGALALGSVVSGRLYRSEYSNWTAMLFVVSGPSGVGKNYIQVGVERLLMNAGLAPLVAGDFYTHQSALYSALRKSPAHICISDEFGENFYEARKNNNSNKMTVFKAFKKVYSAADHIFKAESYSTMGKTQKVDEIGPVLNPSLTLVGLTTPMQFYSEIKTSHIEGGLMNRLVIVNVDAEKVAKRTVKSDIPPEHLIDWIKRVHRSEDVYANSAYDMQPDPVVVKFSEPAKLIFSEFEITQQRTSDALEPQGMASMPMRWRENAMRMATMLASCDAPDAPVVSPTHAQWSCDYVQAKGLAAIRALGSQAGENDYQQQMNKVLEYIREAGEEGRSATELSSKFRAIKKKDMEAIRDHLVESGMLLPPLERKTTGRSVRLWVAADWGDDQ